MSQQITRSNVANKTRLKVLSARQELLDGIFEEAQKKLGEATKDKKRYTEILKNLILEGFYALNESKLQVRGRKQDYDLIKKAIEGATAEYKERTKKDISASIDEENPQPEGRYGPCYRSNFAEYLLIDVVLVASPSSVEEARSTLTIPSKNA